MDREREELAELLTDPVAKILIRGEVQTVQEAEELYLDNCLAEVVRLLESGLSDEELGRHPLMQMLRAHGSRGWEEALD